MAKKVLWAQMRRNEFEAAAKADAVVIVPVASTEQHGEHLPVNTDANACSAIAQRAAEEIDDFPVLVLPAIWTGYSPTHMAYPGTITLKYKTFVDVLTDVAVSIRRHGFKKIFFLNGHGGNDFIVNSMRIKLATEDALPTVVGYTWWNFPSVLEEMERLCQADRDCAPRVGERDTSVIGHAGERETSLQLYLQPELVDKKATHWVRGVWGDPSAGTRQKGERLFRAAVDALVKILRDYHSGKLEEGLIRGGGHDGSTFEGDPRVGRL